MRHLVVMSDVFGGSRRRIWRFNSSLFKVQPNGSLFGRFHHNELRFNPYSVHQTSNQENQKHMLDWSHRSPGLKASCASQQSPASALRSECFTTEENVILKNKSEEIEPYLDGRCIYLVGMMGSGKTTIGQILSEVIGYSFFDSDKLIEEAAGGTAVADIFKLHGESFFRENETEVLRKLSSMDRVVISTGGGAVVHPINWKYMHKGITVFLDVPLEALARRISAVGTASRPLLHHGSGDAYVKTFKQLSILWNERSEAYTNAHSRVSLENIAANLGHGDVCDVTPTQIAIETLVQIKSYLKK